MNTIETTIKGVKMTFLKLLEENNARGCKTCDLDADDLCLGAAAPCGDGSLIAADDKTKRNLVVARIAIRMTR